MTMEDVIVIINGRRRERQEMIKGTQVWWEKHGSCFLSRARPETLGYEPKAMVS
jgi:hypothetical protein